MSIYVYLILPTSTGVVIILKKIKYKTETYNTVQTVIKFKKKIQIYCYIIYHFKYHFTKIVVRDLLLFVISFSLD